MQTTTKGAGNMKHELDMGGLDELDGPTIGAILGGLVFAGDTIEIRQGKRVVSTMTVIATPSGLIANDATGWSPLSEVVTAADGLRAHRAANRNRIIL